MTFFCNFPNISCTITLGENVLWGRRPLYGPDGPSTATMAPMAPDGHNCEKVFLTLRIPYEFSHVVENEKLKIFNFNYFCKS